MIGKTRRPALAGVLLAAVLSGCGGGGEGTSGPSPAPAPGGGGAQTVTDQGVVSGTIKRTDGQPLAAARVEVGGVSAVSNEQGFFVVERVPQGANRTLTFAKDGFVGGNQQVTVGGGRLSHLELVARAVGVTRTGLSASTPQLVSDSRPDGRNGSVQIPANAVVDSAGRAVSSYTVELTTMLPSDANYLQSFPGRFLGGGAPGSIANPIPLRSFGIVNVDLKDGQGNVLKLASGAQATLTFPLDASPTHDPGTSTVPLWYLDTASGIWIQEGSATRTGSTYVGQVRHFTPWNCDVGILNSGTKEVRVVDRNGNLVPDALVFLQGTGYQQYGSTGSAGVLSLLTAPNDPISVWATKGTLKSSVITEFAPGPGQTKVNVIVIDQPVMTTMLTWSSVPADLDAHLTGPNGLHIYFASKGSATGAPFAKLDTDDLDGFGPEIATMTLLNPGTYRFSVHNYRGQTAGSIQGSGAVVNLALHRNNLLRRYDVPTSNPTNGNLWVVFEMTVAANGDVAVRDVSEFRTVEGANSVP